MGLKSIAYDLLRGKITEYAIRHFPHFKYPFWATRCLLKFPPRIRQALQEKFELNEETKCQNIEDLRSQEVCQWIQHNSSAPGSTSNHQAHVVLVDLLIVLHQWSNLPVLLALRLLRKRIWKWLQLSHLVILLFDIENLITSAKEYELYQRSTRNHTAATAVSVPMEDSEDSEGGRS